MSEFETTSASELQQAVSDFMILHMSSTHTYPNRVSLNVTVEKELSSNSGRQLLLRMGAKIQNRIIDVTGIKHRPVFYLESVNEYLYDPVHDMEYININVSYM